MAGPYIHFNSGQCAATTLLSSYIRTSLLQYVICAKFGTIHKHACMDFLELV